MIITRKEKGERDEREGGKRITLFHAVLLTVIHQRIFQFRTWEANVGKII